MTSGELNDYSDTVELLVHFDMVLQNDLRRYGITIEVKMKQKTGNVGRFLPSPNPFWKFVTNSPN